MCALKLPVRGLRPIDSQSDAPFAAVDKNAGHSVPLYHKHQYGMHFKKPSSVRGRGYLGKEGWVNTSDVLDPFAKTSTTDQLQRLMGKPIHELPAHAQLMPHEVQRVFLDTARDRTISSHAKREREEEQRAYPFRNLKLRTSGHFTSSRKGRLFRQSRLKPSKLYAPHRALVKGKGWFSAGDRSVYNDSRLRGSGLYGFRDM